MTGSSRPCARYRAVQWFASPGSTTTRRALLETSRVTALASPPRKTPRFIRGCSVWRRGMVVRRRTPSRRRKFEKFLRSYQEEKETEDTRMRMNQRAASGTQRTRICVPGICQLSAALTCLLACTGFTLESRPVPSGICGTDILAGVYWSHGHCPPPCTPRLRALFHTLISCPCRQFCTHHHLSRPVPCSMGRES